MAASGGPGAGEAILLGGAFVPLLVAACVSDVRTRRVPNGLVALLAVGGIGAGLLGGGAAGGGDALLACTVGLGLWLPLWLLRMLGGGDVKLFAAGAAWLTPSSTLHAAWYAAVAGGLLAFAYLLVRAGPGHAFLRLAQAWHVPGALRIAAPVAWERRMPYALAMAAGLLVAAWHARVGG